MNFDRDKLAGCFAWPDADDATVTLTDPDGVMVGRFHLLKPMDGLALQKMIPDKYGLYFQGCTVISPKTGISRGTRIPFNSVVVSERQSVGVEERLARLEGQNHLAIRRAINAEEKLNKLKFEKEKDDALVLEPATPEPPKANKAPIKEPAKPVAGDGTPPLDDGTPPDAA